MANAVKFTDIIDGLSSLLGIDIYDSLQADSQKKAPCFLTSISSALEKNASGDDSGAFYEAIKLQFLLKHIREIKQATPEIFSDFRSQLLVCSSPDNYYGLRMEIYTAASLIRHGVFFSKRESPDFQIEYKSHNIHIECTSAHVNDYDGRDLFYKISSAIKKKSNKPYANKSTALFVDATNILHGHYLSRRSFDAINLRTEVNSRIKSCAFSWVVVFFYFYNNDFSRFESGYTNIPFDGAADNLVEFIQDFYPVGPSFASDVVPIQHS